MVPLPCDLTEIRDSPGDHSEHCVSECSDNFTSSSVSTPSVSPFTSDFNITDDELNPKENDAFDQTPAYNHEIPESPMNTEVGPIENEYSHITCATMSIPTAAMDPTSALSCERVARTAQNYVSHSTAPSVVNRARSSRSAAYSLMGDNLDTNVKSRYRRIDGHHGESLHYFHSLAIKDRISQLSELEIAPYHICLNSPTTMASELLPSVNNDLSLMNVMVTIVSRVLTTYLPYFAFSCTDIVTWHIEHEYYKEMSTKSNVVC